MSRIEPLPRDAVPDLEAAFGSFESRMGFRANSGLIMARRPAIVEGLAALASAVYGRDSGTVPYALKSCICQIASAATGCLYCQAHFANNVLNAGVAAEKLEALWNFEQSDLFSEAERVALRFTLAASQVPNAVTDAHFEALRRHWDDGQIVEILATACYTAFLNRWNDSLATTLEDRPARVAEQHLRESRWSPGKHAPKPARD
jgi:alkylhydroperoxidase family enzyme